MSENVENIVNALYDMVQDAKSPPLGSGLSLIHISEPTRH